MTLPVCDVAFITVNYNTSQLLEDLITFFRSTEFPFTHRLVVVDNASTDGSQDLLENTPDIVYLQCGENIGYGRGMNRGLRAVESRYACIMNTDLILNKEAMTDLWEFFENTPGAGVASPLITYQDGRIQGFLFHAGLFSAYSNLLNQLISKLLKLKVAFASKPIAVPGVLGAFFMMRRSAIIGHTLFDEDFFFYYEDTDLAHRNLLNGVPCYVLPHIAIVHLGGQSTSLAGARLFYKSRYQYLSKHYGEIHMERIRTLDAFRLWSKHIKYRLLAAFLRTERIVKKESYYSSMAELHHGGIQ